MDKEQAERFRQALERKRVAARRGPARPGEPPIHQQEQEPLRDDAYPPDVRDVRDKSTGHGKKTADKWNQ
jgi:hypothetical protein